MKRVKNTNRSGFTIMEVSIAIALMTIPVIGMGIILADGQRGWNVMYNRVYSDVVKDSYAAGRLFDAVVRRASSDKVLAASNGSSVEVQYSQSYTSSLVDSYAKFYSSGNRLYVDYGTLTPTKLKTSTTDFCGNVSSCVFTVTGKSAQMILTLDNGSQTSTVVTSAVMHNQ